ncbi:unnamed protein product [Nezara viridula]|uniref:Uncharacterized protein n=1 Tax=Nezara viridula TaxID=85310 RepID=A0A9P0H602_NEZVI|nr:unnamed protein product [Nezara viridula]
MVLRSIQEAIAVQKPRICQNWQIVQGSQAIQNHIKHKPLLIQQQGAMQVFGAQFWNQMESKQD